MFGILTIVIAAVLIGGGIIFWSKDAGILPEPPEAGSPFEVTDELIDSIEKAGYEVNTKNKTKEVLRPDLPPLPAGAYRADAAYTTAARKTHTLTVELGIDNDIITNLTLYIDGVKDGFVNPFQQNFAEEVRPLVIGEDINDLSLSQVGYAQQETEAFNNALENIRQQLP